MYHGVDSVGKIKKFVTSSVISGLVVFLPIVIVWAIFSWVYRILTNLVRPITNFAMLYFSFSDALTTMLVLFLLLVICVIAGNFVRTRFGKFIHIGFEKLLLNKVPLYTIVKGAIGQIFGKNRQAFRSVALVRPLPRSNIRMIGFITDDNDGGDTIAIFIPTAPNPTSGFPTFLPRKQVEILEHISVEEGFRIILACGAGSLSIIKKH